MRILWLYGPPGVGDSTTAWTCANVLSDEGVATAYVDIDQLGMVVPAPDDDPHAQRLAARVLAAVGGAARGVAWLDEDPRSGRVLWLGAGLATLREWTINR